MATKSNTLKRKNSGFKFHWWMAVIGIGIIAIVGIIILRFSHAGAKPGFNAADAGCYNVSIYGIPTETLQLGSIGGCVNYYTALLNNYQVHKAFKTNVDVRQVQGGYDYFGPNAVKVTKGFQSAKGLSPTGVVDTATWGAIIKACYIDLECSR